MKFIFVYISNVALVFLNLYWYFEFLADGDKGWAIFFAALVAMNLFYLIIMTQAVLSVIRKKS